MAGSSNFQDHNPALTNTESDATYATDALRTGGIATNNTLPSPWLNKIWRQSSVFCAAFGDMMAAKGYTVSDAVRSTLAGVLANLMTAADFAAAFASAFASAISGYATQAWVTALGYATQAWVTAGFSIYLAGSGYIVFPSWLGGLIIQWGGNVGVGGTYYPITFPNNCFVTVLSTFSSTDRITYQTGRNNSYFISGNNGSGATVDWIAVGN
jgi:hypothetical protein